ncbi:Imm70 family immunity protein [Microbacterium sp. NPDC057944]|uniref:Imm70 family immunity protein n=1 Tax=unclassified Microbacterium TaxID=2609290 RepID=UPI0036AA0E66
MSLRVGPIAYPIGTAAFLGAFFDTITVRLESGARGTRFPHLATLYQAGSLEATHVDAAIAELDLVRRGLRQLPPSAVVWDIDDPTAAPPWGHVIAPTITDLANYFITSDGRHLLDVLTIALDAGRRLERTIAIG